MFKNAWFARLAKEGVADRLLLCEAAVRAESGLIDADFGGGLIKQRVARPPRGKSKGWRVILAFRKSKVAFFLFGFPKSSMANLSEDELKAFKLAAKELLELSGKRLDKLVEQGAVTEVRYEEKLPE